MLDTTQYSMALYFYMYGAFDTSLLKHSYFCHVFTRESTISQQNNIGLKASFQEFMHVYMVPMHSRTPYLHLSGKWSC